MHTTIAVSVTFKVSASGDTVDELLQDSTTQALAHARAAVDRTGARRVFAPTIEGATPLANRDALGAMF